MKKKLREVNVAFFYRKIKDTAVDPKKATPQSHGFDICAAETVTINPGEVKLIPTGLVVKGFFHHSMIAILPRSSLALKKGLILANSMGIIDDDYCNDSDEVKVMLLNITKEPVIVHQGERIAQIIVFKIVSGEAVEYPKPFNENARGGFGSTGGYKETKEDRLSPKIVRKEAVAGLKDSLCNDCTYADSCPDKADDVYRCSSFLMR